MTFPWDNVLPPRQDIKNCALVVVERNQEESLSGVWWFAQLMKIHSKHQNMWFWPRMNYCFYLTISVHDRDFHVHQDNIKWQHTLTELCIIIHFCCVWVSSIRLVCFWLATTLHKTISSGQKSTEAQLLCTVAAGGRGNLMRKLRPSQGSQHGGF